MVSNLSSAVGIYGVWANRSEVDVDLFYAETIFVMTNDIEITMYTLGASFPVLSRYFVTRAAPSTPHSSSFSTWYHRARSPFLGFARRSRRSIFGSKLVPTTTTSELDSVTPQRTNINPKENKTYTDGKYDHFHFFPSKDAPTIESLGSVVDSEGKYVDKGAPYSSDSSPVPPIPQPQSLHIPGERKIVVREKPLTRQERDVEWGRTMWLDTVNGSPDEDERGDPILQAEAGRFDRGIVSPIARRGSKTALI
jgi:hypothetical protein